MEPVSRYLGTVSKEIFANSKKMNVLFLTITRILSVEERELYQDLMRKFRDEGHNVYIVTPRERRYKELTSLQEVNGVHILGVKTLNLQKTSLVEKGIGTILFESQFKAAIQKYISNIDFDLLLYSTPPITFPNVINYLKIAYPKAKTYLLLKDIFPQNAVDLGMLSTSGIKGGLYRYFRRKEKNLYALSDYIGCMSPANVKYVLSHNPEIAPEKVEIAPNSICLCEQPSYDRNAILMKYGLPNNRPILIYGGNLGRPQGIPFLIECLDANKERKDCHFLIIGDGVEYDRIDTWYSQAKPSNVSLFRRLPKQDFELLTGACDIGLVFLDHRFTIPNYPSRTLSYMANKLPILIASDVASDMGPIAESNGFGFWCESNSVASFTAQLNKMLSSDIRAMGQNGFNYLCNNYLVSNTYETIVKHVYQK